MDAVGTDRARCWCTLFCQPNANSVTLADRAAALARRLNALSDALVGQIVTKLTSVIIAPAVTPTKVDIAVVTSAPWSKATPKSVPRCARQTTCVDEDRMGCNPMHR